MVGRTANAAGGHPNPQAKNRVAGTPMSAPQDLHEPRRARLHAGMPAGPSSLRAAKPAEAGVGVELALCNKAFEHLPLEAFFELAAEAGLSSSSWRPARCEPG
jgi:hypothetical protein